MSDPTNPLYQKDFTYTHKNPYHDKLGDFEHFVLRDLEGESFKGLWNEKVFQKKARLNVEIGSGFGEFMIHFCQTHPEEHFIGMDYRFKRSFQVARKLSALGLNNFRYLRAKGERLTYLFDESEINDLYLFFPDPWPKARHHKKRLFQETFLKQAYHVLAPQGTFWIKTDHDGLFEWMNEHLEKMEEKLFSIEMHSVDLYKTHPDHFLASFQTKFEKIFLSQQTKIKALVLKSLKK